MDDHGCPRDYAELVRRYGKLVRKMARHKVGAKNAEDAAQNVLVRIIETDGLAKFDPEKGPFPAYLASFASLRLRGESDKVARVWDNELVLEEAENHAFVEVSYEEVESRVDVERLASRVVRRTASVELAPGVALSDVVVAVFRVADDHGKVTGQLLAEQLGVSVSTAKRWRRRATAAIHEELSRVAA